MVKETAEFYNHSSYEKIKSDFNFINSDGRGHRLLRDSDGDFIVAVFLPDSVRGDIKWLSEVAQSSQDKDLAVFDFQVFSLNQTENREQLKTLEREVGLNKPILTDPTQISALDLNIRHVPDVVVINRVSKRIVARLGRVVPSRLKTVLGEIAQGRPPKVPIKQDGRVPVMLNPILTTESPISYQKHIAPILIRNCVSCHYDDGPAPWSMNNHSSLLEWKKMIREVVTLRRMPPSQTDDYFRTYKNERHLTSNEIRQLVRWIDQGAPKDKKSDPLQTLKRSPTKEFSLGPPDLIISLPQQFIGARDSENVQLLKMEWPLDRIERVRALDIQTNNSKATHHVSLHYLVNSSNEPNEMNVSSFAGSYFPGFEPNFLQFGASYSIPAKAPLRISVHTLPTGKDEVVSMRAGIYFDKSKQPVELNHCSLTTHDFDIPPFAKDYNRVVQGYTTEDTRVIQVGIHMHKRGRSAQFYADLPDKNRQVLISLPNYNYGWQKDYQLSEPLFLPKGTRLTCDARYDNSLKNIFLSDASKRIGYGWRNDDEMLICYCYGLREEDYQRMVSKKKIPYKPMKPEDSRYIIQPVTE
jgi:hypothetical protein